MEKGSPNRVSNVTYLSNLVTIIFKYFK